MNPSLTYPMLAALTACAAWLCRAALGGKDFGRNHAALLLAVPAPLFLANGTTAGMAVASVLALLPILAHAGPGSGARGPRLFALTQTLATFLLLGTTEALASGTVTAGSPAHAWVCAGALVAFYVRAFGFPFHAVMGAAAETCGWPAVAQYLILPVAPLAFARVAPAVMASVGPEAGIAMAVLCGAQLIYFGLLAQGGRGLGTFPLVAHQVLALPLALALVVGAPETVLGLVPLATLGLALTVTGMTLVVAALEDRYGRLDLRHSHGLYGNDAVLAQAFLFFGLLACGVPGTVTFVLEDAFLTTFEGENWPLVTVILLTNALVAVGAFRAFTKLFHGRQRTDGPMFASRWPEKAAFVSVGLVALALGWVAM